MLCCTTHRQGDSLEELKAVLQRESAGVDLSGIEPLPVPAPVPTPDQPYGYDGSQEGERDFSVESGERGVTNSGRGGVRSFVPTAAAASVPVPVPAAASKKRSAAEKRGAKRRGAVRRMSSATSYKAGSVYDRDYTFEEHDIHLFPEAKKDPETTGIKGQGQEIVTIPCDLTDAGSAVEVMRELKRMGIDDKVALPSLALPSLHLHPYYVECCLSLSMIQSL
jgi:hypothetical protein